MAIATSFGRWIHWVEADQLADVVSMFVGTIIVLFVWNQLVLFVWHKLLGRFENNEERESG